MKSDKAKERSFTLSDIKDGASYEFRVSAVNKAGQGPPSASSAAAKYGQQLCVLCLICHIPLNFYTVHIVSDLR